MFLFVKCYYTVIDEFLWGIIACFHLKQLSVIVTSVKHRDEIILLLFLGKNVGKSRPKRGSRKHQEVHVSLLLDAVTFFP